MKIKLIILITLFLTSMLGASTIYEDGHGVSNWRISDNRPSGATVNSVIEDGNSVIELNGTGVKNAFLLGDKRASSRAWDNVDDTNITWSMKFDSSFKISIFVNTTKGKRVLYYDNRLGQGKRRTKIYYGLGSQISDREWHTITRDIVADIKRFEPTNELIMVYGFEVRGSGKIGSIFMTSNTNNSKVNNNISLIFINNASSSFTINQDSVLLEGYASSNIGVKSITCTNQLTTQEIVAQGTQQWSAIMPLNQGDNEIECVALADDDITTNKVNVTVVYYQNSSFTSLLGFSENTFFTDETKSITAQIGVHYDTTSNIIVKLYEVDDNNNIKPAINYQMFDNGVLPDEIDKDEIFTVNFILNENSVSDRCYKVGVTGADGNEYFSEKECINIVKHITQEEMQEFISIGEDVMAIYALNSDPKIAAQVVYNILINNPRVGAVGINEDGESIWYISTSGIAGGYSKFKNNFLGGIRSSNQEVNNKNYPKIDEIDFIKDYTSKNKNNYLKKSFGNLSQKKSTNSNEISSKKSLGIYPFTNNPNGLSVGGLYSAWNVIKNKNSCQLYATSKKVNNGSVSITIDDFKNLSSYGYIHISTHGDNFYQGLFSMWNPVWGPNSWLQGYLSQVVLYTGIKLKKDASGNYIYGQYEKDIKAHRIVLSGGLLAITPAFIKKYVKKLPNSMVVLEACRSGYNSSMADAFLSRGAKSVLGYTNYVHVSYAENTTNEFITKLLEDKNTLEAINSATSLYGSQDSAPYYAKPKLFGSKTLKLASVGLKNGGFEYSTLTPWEKVGDGRVITGLGVASPTEGNFMGIISTGLGYTTAAGSIEQTTCLKESDTTLNFDWNFFSEEFKEWCNSIYQDTFKVTMCEFNSTTNTNSNCTILFQRTIDDLCDQVSKVNNNFDQGDVYATGWHSENIDISSYAGKSVSLQFYSTDVGDSIFDSAILLDDIKIQ